MKKVLFVCGFLMVGLIGSANAWIYKIGAPQDTWKTAVAVATYKTDSPYKVTSGSITIEMDDYTGVLIRAKYLRGETLTTDPIVHVFAVDSTGTWSTLKDANGSRAITLADNSTTDCDDGAVYKYTDMSAKIDALGSTAVRLKVITAGVSSSAGAIAIELKRY